MFELAAYLEERKGWIEAVLDRRLPPEDERPAKLHAAMRYAALAGGKRLRPILCRACAEAFGGARIDLDPAAAAIELLHTYTLIHDDLPAMDNDDLRRGRPTTHRVFGEANAILAGDALLTLSFELLAECPAPAPHPPCALAGELAHAVGSRGLAGGQFEDLAAEGEAPTADRLEFIHRNKTARLFEAACRMGAIAAGADAGEVDRLGCYGDRLGIAFQIADDLLNATSTPEALGKAAGSDTARGKLTAVAVYGLDEARARARALIEEARDQLDGIGAAAEPLQAIAAFAIDRPA